MTSLSTLDDIFVKTERIVVPSTSAMKSALVEYADSERDTVSNIVREAIVEYIDKCPDLRRIYSNKAHQLLRENK